MFLVTDKENKTFGGFSWSQDATNETDNPNHYFRLYETIEEAIYLSPFFGFKEEFNIWRAEGSDNFIEERTSKRFSKVKTNFLEKYEMPTKEQRITVAILCSLNLVGNQDFIRLCSSYLKNEDNIKEQAFIIRDSIADTDEESERFSCAVPLLSCITSDEKVEELTAATIFRSISDSVDLDDPVDLNKIFKITSFVPRQEIGSIIF